METTTESQQTKKSDQPIVLDTFDYGRKSVSARTVARQKWDMLAIDSRDGEKILWALENYFEPFSSTTVPNQNKISGQLEVAVTVWFKRPAHLNEEALVPGAAEKKDNVSPIIKGN